MTESGRTWPRRVGEWLLRILGIFVILEPIWMLLPFAGFLYGSVLRIETLSRNPDTAWLTHFVFPVLAIGWGGPALAILGLLVFFVGAGQIYTAKFRKSGLVTGGLYRFVRHPQYIALTLFGLGILLTWGRAIAYVGFFLMMWLYYWLAKHEEARCARLFGEDWVRFRERTSFILPGDRRLRGLGSALGLARWPAPVRVLAGLLVAAGLCIGSMQAVNAWKRARLDVPFLLAEIEFSPGAAAGGVELGGSVIDGVPLVRNGRLLVARGPWRSAAAPGFAERLARRLPESAALAGFLDLPEDEFAVAFGVPLDAPVGEGPPATPRGPGAGDGRGPPPDPAGPDRVRVMILRTVGDPFVPDGEIEFCGARIAPVDLGRPDGEDLVTGDVFTPGPRFPAAERFAHLVEQVRAQWATAAPPPVAATPAAGTDLVFVKAPILRTRIDPEFAETLRDRLLASATFRDRIEKLGAGNDIVPIAFPRPGPNWYREHHGEAQISFFVVLARPRNAGGAVADLFRPDGRELVGAFTAELDLGIAPPADPVGRIELIGPARDLEERFAFFLSGL